MDYSFGKLQAIAFDESAQKPVHGIMVRFYLFSDQKNDWNQFAVLKTDTNGSTPVMPDHSCAPGYYLTAFHVASYYDLKGLQSLVDLVKFEFKLYEPGDPTIVKLSINDCGYSVGLS